MKPSKTQQNKTQNFSTQHSRCDVLNKDPDYDYCFRRKRDIEEGGGMDQYGWQPVGEGNESGEKPAIPFLVNTKAKKQIAFDDVVLCRRKKEVTRYFKQIEDDAYNAQQRFIATAAKRAQVSLRQLDQTATVEDQSEIKFTQRPGPTEEE